MLVAPPLVAGGNNNNRDPSPGHRDSSPSRRQKKKTTTIFTVLLYGLIWFATLAVHLSIVPRRRRGNNNNHVASSKVVQPASPPQQRRAVDDATATAAAAPGHVPDANRHHAKLRIALVVSSQDYNDDDTEKKIRNNKLNHIINKACYAHLHRYDFIFKGSSHPVADMLQAALPHYDWILYADIDWVVQDMSLPIETLLRELYLHGKSQVSVYLPPSNNHHNNLAVEPSVLMIRNDEFGRRLLENWMKFFVYVCPKGNFKERTISPLRVQRSGLWYALAQTHAELRKDEFKEFGCNNDGYIRSHTFLSKEMRAYFKRQGYVAGSHAADELDAVVHKDQPIVWTRLNKETRSGLGVPYDDGKEWPHAFALHVENTTLPPAIQRSVGYCKRTRGCHAYYDNDGSFLQVGCNRTDLGRFGRLSKDEAKAMGSVLMLAAQ